MVFLTGATGAIGNSIMEVFAHKKYEVVILVRDKSKIKYQIPSIVRVEEGDLLDVSAITRVFNKYPIEVVINCAWNGVTGQDRNKSNQIDNFFAQKNLLDVCGNAKIKTFIGLGSQAEYGIYNSTITEQFVPRPNSYYGLYKLSAGLLGSVMARQFGFNYAWLRLFAAYGPKDSKAFVIPYTIDCLLNNTTPNLSSCDQYWDYLFLLDIPHVLDKMIHYPYPVNDVFNLSSGKAVQLKSIILLIKTLLRSEIDPNFGSAESRNDALSFLEGSNEKIVKTFKLDKFTDLEAGLESTINWYKHAINNSK